MGGMKRVGVRYSWIMGAVLVIGLGASTSLNYIVDPLQYFRRADYVPLFTENQRYQNPGLARNYPYDTIVTGSSLTQAFLAADVEAALGGKVLRMPINGSSALEHALLIEVAYRTGRLRRVIRDVHYSNVMAPPDITKGDRGEFPRYLYDTNPWNDLAYLANFDTFALTARVLLSRLGVLPLRAMKVEHLYTDVLKRPKGIERVAASYRHVMTLTGEGASIDNALTNIEDNYARLARDMPDVQFVYFFPPYSAAWYAARMDNPLLELDTFLRMKAAFYAATIDLPNVTIFDFQCREDLIFNFDEYRDQGHYTEAIGRQLLAEMAEGKGRVTPETVDDNVSCIRERTPYWRDKTRSLLGVE